MESLKFFLLFPATILAIGQEIVLYSEESYQGSNKTISETSVSDLSILSFDNQAYSVCAAGIWILFSNTDYNPDVTTVDTSTMYVHGFGLDNYKFCRNLPSPPGTKLAGQVSSVRFAGVASNYSADSITIYEFLNFQGRQLMVTRDITDIQSNIAVHHKSLIITGSASWTVCTKFRYEGICTCVEADEPDDGWPMPTFVTDLSSRNIDYGSIKSMKKGC